MSENSTTRFSNRVEDYVKYRPAYPPEIVDFLQNKYQLSSEKLIADIGAGTGISAALFLKRGYQVIAVEPNGEMREKSLELLGSYKNFKAINGTAENSGLENASVDVIIAGQAFHWFDVIKTKAEFKRILKPKGLTVLLWNERKTSCGFEQDYDKLIIKHAHDYVQVDHRNINAADIASFFDPSPVELEIFSNHQVFNFEGLKGRLLSSSYMPARNETGHKAMIDDLKILFEQYRQNEMITINYDTKLYAGRL
ncbi:MAG: methyltransferase domain-containing protein [Ferruginibacter sp.]